MADTHGRGEGDAEAQGSSEVVGAEEAEELLNYANDGASLGQLKELVADLAVSREKKKKYKELAKGEEKIIDEISQTIISIMTTMGMKNATFEDVGKVSVVEEHYASFRKADEEKVFKTLEELGHGDMVKRTVHASTFKRWFKDEAEQREAQGATPLKHEFAGAVNVFEKVSVRFRKA